MGLCRAAVLTDYPAFAQKLGLSVARQFRDAGLTPAMLAQPDALIPGECVVRLLEQSAAKSRCATFGLGLAELRQLSHFGVVGLLLAHQRTPRDALQMALQYQHLINPTMAVFLEESAGDAILRTEVLTDVPMQVTQSVELLVASSLQLIRVVAGAQWRPRSVHFRHRHPGNLEVHQRIFRCACVFEDNFNGMLFPAGDLDLVNPSVDPTLGWYARRFIDAMHTADAGSPATDVRRLVHLFLPTRRATIKQVSQSLGRNTRSLQRDLDREGISFSSLVNSIRRELAVDYLTNPRFEVGQVAGLLGYSRPGSFTRWFVQEFGVTPVDWRRRRVR